MSRSAKTSTAAAPGVWDLRRHAPLLIALVIAAIPFTYGKYIEFNTKDAFDSGLNVYHAKCIVDGQKIGKSVYPSARPATLLMNVIGVGIFGYSELGPKLIQILCQLAALILMYFTLRKVYGQFPAAVALVLAAFYLSCPPFAKFGNAKEQFMIAFMIISACALMMRYLGGRWWWLVLSGAAAANIHFFKPTGVSVIVAMTIYLLAMPIMRQRKWSQFGSDIVGLLVGLLIGFIPLTIFYVAQDQFTTLLGSLPGAKDLKILYRSFISTPAGPAGGYVQSSQSVSNFATQFDTVMRYYRMLIVPIGFSLLAIAAGLVSWIGSFFLKSKKTIESNQTVSSQRNFLLLFAIWWILDMLFIWISPRSYVQYYLPLMASAAMLAAYATSRCQKNPITFLWLMGAWLILDLLLVWVVPSQNFFSLGFRPEGPEGFWKGWAIQLIPLIIAAGVYFLAKGLPRSTRAIVVALACGYALLCWSGVNMRAFEKRVDDLALQKATNNISLWEQMAQTIKKNSQPDDGLYVWGWFPGIYVSSQRFCPSVKPAYSDMHTDSPEEISKIIQKLVRRLKKNPPKFIVDSKKMHYPYNDHPLFDLWPIRITAKKEKQFLPPQVYPQFTEQLHAQAQELTMQYLTRKNRTGGPIKQDRARKLAQTERRRNEAMEPLREFVIKNYRPVVAPDSPMILFRYHPVAAQSLD